MYFFSSVHVRRKGSVLSRISSYPGVMVHMPHRQLSLHKFHASKGCIVRPCLTINGVRVEEKAQCLRVFSTLPEVPSSVFSTMLSSSQPHVTPISCPLGISQTQQRSFKIDLSVHPSVHLSACLNLKTNGGHEVVACAFNLGTWKEETGGS